MFRFRLKSEFDSALSNISIWRFLGDFLSAVGSTSLHINCAISSIVKSENGWVVCMYIIFPKQVCLVCLDRCCRRGFLRLGQCRDFFHLLVESEGTVQLENLSQRHEDVHREEAVVLRDDDQRVARPDDSSRCERCWLTDWQLVSWATEVVQSSNHESLKWKVNIGTLPSRKLHVATKPFTLARKQRSLL